MHIAITYCKRCGHASTAASLAAEIQTAHGLSAELRRGDGGVFDVAIDGELIFSKHEAGRFPDASEILDEIADRQRRAGQA